jgi:hypothetical protein
VLWGRMGAAQQCGAAGASSAIASRPRLVDCWAAGFRLERALWCAPYYAPAAAACLVR